MSKLFDIFKTFRPRRTILSEDFNALQTALVAAFDRIGTAPPSGETGVSSTFHAADPVEDQHVVTKGYFANNANPVFTASIALAQAWAEEADNTDVNGILGARSAKHWANQAQAIAQGGGALPTTGGQLTGDLEIREVSPTLALRDTDAEAGFLHVNGGIMYFLGGAVDGTTWAQVNGQWPMTVNLTNNNVNVGNDLAVVGNISAANYNNAAWDSAYAWGDHSVAGYVTQSINVSFLQTTVTSLVIGSWTISEVGGKLMFNNGTNRVSISAAGVITADGDVVSEGTP